jgi:hypothetical protein
MVRRQNSAYRSFGHEDTFRQPRLEDAFALQILTNIVEADLLIRVVLMIFAELSMR